MSEKQELNIEANHISLLRTTFDTNLALTCYVDQRKGAVLINQTTPEAIEKAATEAIELAKSSPQDEANDIAEYQPPEEFAVGHKTADLEAMYDRFSTFLTGVQKRYPTLRFDPAVLDFTTCRVLFQNTNGVDFLSLRGRYGFSGLFSAKEGQESSSFNHTSFSTLQLDQELERFGSLETLMQQTTEQIQPKNLPEKFVGDIIITPDCLSSFLSFYLNSYLGDRSLITETSLFKDKLNEQVASPKFSWRSCPRSQDIAQQSFVTSDGFASQDFAYVEKGVLRQFALSLYGSNKTGKQRAPNDSRVFCVDPGEPSFAELVQSVKKGILVCRFSGGHPGDSGDFSGVAKNSYLIEDGQIQYPLKETMIAGNLATMFRNIVNISKERINFGSSILPWMQCSDISVSGK